MECTPRPLLTFLQCEHYEPRWQSASAELAEIQAAVSLAKASLSRCERSWDLRTDRLNSMR